MSVGTDVDVREAQVLAALDDLTARTETALRAPGLHAPVVALGRVLTELLSLLRDEVTGESTS